MSDTIHRIVTELMIAALEHGTIPWHKPWHAEAGRPRSMSERRSAADTFTPRPLSPANCAPRDDTVSREISDA
jgi:N-terminal domain of anti-restriction factor ArdC